MKNIKKLQTGLSHISQNSAYIKLDENKDFPVDYVKIDGKIYDGQDDGKDILDHCAKIRKATEMARNLNSIVDHGNHIDPFIIEYHPTWIYLRDANGFNDITDDDILCEKENSSESYLHLMQDNYIAIGMNVPFIDDIDLNTSMSYDEFYDLYEQEKLDEIGRDFENNHPDFVAFYCACFAKQQIDRYREECDHNLPITTNYKSVSYHLDKNRFPIITIGKGKNKKRYDFRNAYDIEAFNIKMANRATQKSKTECQKKKIR